MLQTSDRYLSGDKHMLVIYPANIKFTESSNAVHEICFIEISTKPAKPKLCLLFKVNPLDALRFFYCFGFFPLSPSKFLITHGSLQCLTVWNVCGMYLEKRFSVDHSLLLWTAHVWSIWCHIHKILSGVVCSLINVFFWFQAHKYTLYRKKTALCWYKVLLCVIVTQGKESYHCKY